MPRLNRRTLASAEFAMNVDLPADIVERLDDYVDQTGMKKKDLVHLALKRFLDAEAPRKPSTGRTNRG